MPGLKSAVVAALSLAALPVHAADITNVLSSFDKDQPFGFDLQVSYDRLQHRALINRENHQLANPADPASGAILDVAEARFTEVNQKLPIRAAVGLWHDIELHATLPIVLLDARSWGYPGGSTPTNAGNSSVANNCVTGTGDYACGTAAAKFPASYGTASGASTGLGSAYRAGIGDLTVGLAYAPFNEKRDDTKPTWVIGFDYTYPLAPTINPSLPTSASNTGPVGDGVHKYRPYMAFSKRVGAIDPYVQLEAVLPYNGPNYYSNCATPSTQAFAADCNGGGALNGGTPYWTKSVTGQQAPYIGKATFGAEFWAYDDPEHHQYVTIDLRGEGSFVSDGRYYNEMSDALGKLLYTEQYFRVGGHIGINARAAQYVQLKIMAAYYHDTYHFLTNESVGQDLNGNGQVDLNTQEVNPNYDFRWDSVGRRFRISQVNDFEVSATGQLTF